MQAPQQIKPTKLADYLEVMTKAVFQSGISWQVIEAKWDGFREAFAAFDPAAVAGFSVDDVDRLAEDTRIVRNRRKIEATVTNARDAAGARRRSGRLRRLAALSRRLRRHRRGAAWRVPLSRRHRQLLLPLRGRREGAGARGVDEDAWFHCASCVRVAVGPQDLTPQGGSP